MDKVKSWIQASRLPSQAYIFFPLLLGQAIAFKFTGEFNILILILVIFFGIVNQLYIVYANDYADFEIDKINDTYNMFSGGSRVLVEGKIDKNELKKGIIITVLLNLATGIILNILYGRSYSIPIILFALFLLWAYSYKPIELSYKGGGEFLQAIGVGIILPLFGYYAQSGRLDNFPLIFIAVYIPIQIGCAFSTTLPDYPSDKLGSKKTFAVIFGFEKIRGIILILNFMSFTLFLLINSFNIALLNKVLILIIPVIVNVIMFLIKNKSENKTKFLDLFVAFNILSLLCFTFLITLNLFR